MDKIAIFGQNFTFVLHGNFNFCQTFLFLANIFISGQHFDFWSKFEFLPKVETFVCPKFRFLTKIWIFAKNFEFWTKFRFLTKIWIFAKNFEFWTKLQFLTEISSFFSQNFDKFYKKFTSAMCLEWHDGDLANMMRSSTVKKHSGNRPRQRRSVNLEFSECWLDPPRFRSAVHVYENEIEGTHKALKNLVKNIDVSRHWKMGLTSFFTRVQFTIFF